ncbi:MAG TPA: TonB-dependent siderophore receptor [Methylocystis sp.]|nr:TonB-dependent siderophore receptor [Methylocystis sp.]
MFRSALGRGASIAAVASALTSASLAQESLPTIEVGGQRPNAQAGASSAAGGQGTSAATTPISGVAQPPREDNETYRPENAFSATKTNTPVMETPASIQVVPRAVLNDEQAVEISQAINNVSGVIATDERLSGTPTFWIRGYLTNIYYIDGVRFDSINSNTNQDLSDIDRVEVLKGPASILYGRGDPGGLINLVRKQPLEKPYAAIEQQFGSWGDFRTTLDTTGPLTKDNTLLYRFNLAWEDRSNFIESSNVHLVHLAPTVRWNVDAHTYLNVYLTYNLQGTHDETQSPVFTSIGPNSSYPWYAFAFGTGSAPILNLPRNQNLSPPWSKSRSEEIDVGYLFSRDLNEDWNLRSRFNAQLADFIHWGQFPLGWDNIDGVPFQVSNIGEFLSDWTSQSYYADVELTGKVKTGDLDHTLLIGSDLQHFNFQGNPYIALPTSFGGPIQPINPLYPISTSVLAYLPFNYPSSTGEHEVWWGVSFQDQIKLPMNFFFLAGGRYDHVINYNAVGQTNPVTGYLFNNGRITSDAQRVTPRFGLLWRPIPWFSVYGSYLTNFGNLPTESRNPLPPESAQQWEVGVKTELLDDRLTATLAYYDLTKQHIAYPDPTDPTGLSSLALGEARNRGVELDVAGEILPGWKIIAGYSYIASIITKDGGLIYDNYSGALLSVTGNQGKRLGGVPRDSGNLFTTYEFQAGPLKGLKLGGGALARSLAQGDNWNDFHLPGYATMSLLAAYTTTIYDRKTTFQLNVDNVLDTRYATEAYVGPLSVYNGQPRRIKGAIKVEF